MMTGAFNQGFRSFRNTSHKVANARPLTDDELFRHVPSIFAEGAHESRSKRYAYIPTVDVLRGLQKEGFLPFAASQGKCRIEGKELFTKHMIRFRHVDALAKGAELDKSVNEIILINSHDGTSAYKMLAGVFRIVCLNGLVSGSIVEEVHVKHSGKVVEGVVGGAYKILAGFDKVDASKDAMQSLQLTTGEQRVFAEAALALRYPDRETIIDAPITVDQVIQPRRMADQRDDLWTVFNRAQENLVAGGLEGQTRDGNGRVRRTTTRAVNGIDGNVALNRALWVLAERMKEMKAAA